MKKKPAAATRTAVTRTKSGGLAPLLTEVRRLIQSARRGTASVVNTLQVMTNFEIGRRIVEHEQKGDKRAAYGVGVLKELSARLTEEFGQGFSERNLEYMRKFYLLWRTREVEISQTPSAKLNAGENFQTPAEELAVSPIVQKASGRSSSLSFTLSWSHYV